MARRITAITTLTPTATADASTTLASGTYPCIVQGGSTTQTNYIWEISISGQAAATSSPTFMILARDSTVGVTNSLGTGQTDTPKDPNTAVLSAPVLVGNTNTTPPQRSTTAKLMNCSLNAFGGVYFWRANKVEECVRLYGNAATLGEVSLSAFTGGTPGAIGSHLEYESI